MDNEVSDVKKAWNTSISNIVDQTQYAIDNVVEQIKKSQIESIEKINNYRDDAYLMAKNILDRSIEMQKTVIINLFGLPITRNYPFKNTFFAIPFEDVIHEIENISNIYAKILITSLESDNVFASKIPNNIKSANRDLGNIFIEQLQYNTTQMANFVKKAIGEVKNLSRTTTGGITSKEQENVKKIERYVHIDLPWQISVGKTAPLTVIVKAKSTESSLIPSTMAIGIGQIELKVPPNKEEVKLLAYFSQEDSKFDLEDKVHLKEIIIPVNDEDSQPVVFDLTAKRGGTAKIKIQFFKAAVGGYIGEIPLQSNILDATKPMDESSNDYLKALSVPVTIGKFHPDVSLLNSDATLLILQKDSASGSKYEVYIASPTIEYRSIGTVSLTDRAKSNFIASFKEIESTALLPEIIDDNVKNIGLQLYKEIIKTTDLHGICWEYRSNIKSIQVVSMEPWIPWEILKPTRKINGDVEEDDFLCERYAFCRWQLGPAIQIKKQVRKVKVIVPSGTKLKGVLEERDWIKEFITSKGLNVSFASSYMDVMSTLRTGDYDIIHFSTHGEHNIDAPVLSEIELGNGAKLKPDAINGRAQNFGQSNPLVILNACQSGVLDFSFAEVQGWATAFLEAGASAFICTLWSVTDEIALKFTKELYNQLFNGVPLGEAVRISRLECRKSGDPSWLAYQVYGHPNMKIEI